MRSLLVFCFQMSLIFVYGQRKTFEVYTPSGFSKEGYSFAYFNKSSGNFHVNLQNKTQIFRVLYDSNFNALNKYEFVSDNMSFNSSETKMPQIAEVIESTIGHLEVYTDLKKILILKPDFQKKKDSIVLTKSIQTTSSDERLVTLIPEENGLKILSMSPKSNTLYLNTWFLGDTNYSDKKEYLLPATNFENADIRKFPKPVRIQFKNSIGYIQARPVDYNSFFSTPISGNRYYTKEKLYLIFYIKYHIGLCVLELDLNKSSFKLTNYLINDLKYNSDVHPLNKRSLSYVIYDSMMLIRNVSAQVLEYHFYNLNSGKKIKEYTTSSNQKLNSLIHSDYKQIGTWASRKQEKDVDRDKAFQRKIKYGGIFLSSFDKIKDSITITHIAFNYTQGIEGTLLSAATFQLGYMANIHFGPIQIVPYIYSYRYKLAYAHSRFSINDMQLSKSNSIRTTLDKVLEDLDRKEFSASSSFFVKDKKSLLLGNYNTQTRQFQITEYNEE